LIFNPRDLGRTVDKNIGKCVSFRTQKHTHSPAKTPAHAHAHTRYQKRLSIYLPAASRSSKSAMSRKRFFTRDLCTHTRLRASLSPSLASSTSRTQGARRGNGRCILPPLTAWVLFRGRSFFSPSFPNRHLSSIMRRVTFGQKKNLSLLHFCTTKTFFM